jgi:hypothetical protein
VGRLTDLLVESACIFSSVARILTISNAMALTCVKRLKLTKDIARYEDGAVSSDYPDCVVVGQKAKSLQPMQIQ